MPRKLNPEEREAFNSYHKPGGSNLSRCKINQICLSMAETDEHNLKMIDICRELIVNGNNFITEACPNKIHNRRVDIVNLSEQGEYKDGGVWIEIETKKSTIKPDADVTYLLLTDKKWKKILRDY